MASGNAWVVSPAGSAWVRATRPRAAPRTAVTATLPKAAGNFTNTAVRAGCGDTPTWALTAAAHDVAVRGWACCRSGPARRCCGCRPASWDTLAGTFPVAAVPGVGGVASKRWGVPVPLNGERAPSPTARLPATKPVTGLGKVPVSGIGAAAAAVPEAPAEEVMATGDRRGSMGNVFVFELSLLVEVPMVALA